MSVLCKWGLVGPNSTKDKENISKIFLYEDFLQTIELIDSLVAVNGYLVLHNCNYSLEHTSYFKKYRSIKQSDDAEYIGYVHRYLPDGTRDYDTAKLCNIFLKISD